MFLKIKDAVGNNRYICICCQISLWTLCLDVKFCRLSKFEWQDSMQHMQKSEGLEPCSDIVSLYVGQCQEIRMHLKAQCKMMLQRWARANICYHLNLSTGWETGKTGYLLCYTWEEKPMNQIKRALNNWLKYYSPFWLYYLICSYFHVSSIEIPSHSDTLFSDRGNSFLYVMFQTNLKNM